LGLWKDGLITEVTLLVKNHF